jgi:hypothetical protein
VTVTGAGATWTNNLADDGSITVFSLAAPPTLNFAKLGNSLQFSWSGAYRLQAQTSSLNVGLGSNWADYPGGTNGVTVPIDARQEIVFYRIVPP